MKRKDIHVVTLRKIEKFLNEQTKPVFRSNIVKKIGVDFNSLNFALILIKHEKDKEGRIYL